VRQLTDGAVRAEAEAQAFAAAAKSSLWPSFVWKVVIS